MFIWLGVKTIFYSLSDLFSRYVVTTTFLISLFLWAMSIFYVPSVVIVALTFFFTGLFAASLEREGMLKTKTFSLSDHPKLSFVSVLLLMFILIGSVTLGYMVFQRSASLVYFQKSLNSYQKDQNVDTAGALMAKAVNLGGYDVYYRVMSQIDLARVNQLLAKPGITPESIRDPFQKEVGTAIANAKKSTEISPENYQNWISLAQVYAALVPQPFAIPGAYENALTTFNKAVEVAPMNPTTQLLLARLEVAHNDVKKAREYAAKAVELKSNYAEAHFLLAQIEATEGNVAKAISSLETTLLLSPENPGLFFQLGLLKYNQKDFEGAVQAFAQAVVKVPDYANARYFLGLSLYNIDRVQEALAQFEEVAKTNPDNQELMTIITNLKSGKAPLATIPPPGNKPETRDKLPLEQRN
jgi:tetratricopeptide (TPR) repeat protein